MQSSCRACGRLDVGRPTAGLTALMLSGCTVGDYPSNAGVLALIAFALALTAGLAFALGSLRARHAQGLALRRAREDLRATQQLQATGLWQTDAAHAVTAWQPAHGSPALICPVLETMDPVLLEQLRAQAAFSDLRLVATSALAPSRLWTLCGAPRYDETGAFAGFIGQARDSAEVTDAVACAAALPALLSACPVAAVVALRLADGHWQAQHANAAARTLWPQLQWPTALDALAAQLPAPVADALRGALADGEASVSAAGWRIECFDTPFTGPRGLVLAQQTGPQAADDAPDGESDTFSFTASHDLRAPIRVVEGFTRIVKEDYGHLLDRVGNDHLDRVLGAASRMNLMIDALLTLARLSQQPLARQPVNLSQLAGYIVDELRRTSPERDADIEIQPGLGATGDPTLLRLVLENLLGNAWKYSARAERTQISLRAVPHERGLAYVVRDNGAGFDMRSADRLFGLFQRLHSASEFPGHGVGLASVRRIVHRHGGDIWAEAEPGRGAAFYFTLAK